MEADQGDRVKAGALLFRLEDGDVRQQVAMAESEAAAAMATLAKLEAAQRKAEVVAAQARTHYERIDRLRSGNVASQQDYDKALEALSVAEAEALACRGGDPRRPEAPGHRAAGARVPARPPGRHDDRGSLRRAGRAARSRAR